MTDLPTAQGGLIDLSAPGPLLHIKRALQERLRAVFPVALFAHHMLPASITPVVFDRLVQKCPAIGLGWTGIDPGRDNGRQFSGIAQWQVVLVTQNAGGADARFGGDALAPGLLSMTSAACIALQGWTITGAQEFQAAGTVEVHRVDNLFPEHLDRDAIAMAGVSIRVPYSETFNAGPAGSPDDFLSASVSWGFPPAGAIDDTWIAPGWANGATA